MINMGTVWDRTGEFLGDNLAALLPIVLLALFVPFSISASIAPLKPDDAGMRAALGLASLILSLVTMWGQLAVIALALDPVAGRRAAVARTNRRFPTALGVSLLLLLGTILLFAPVGVALAVSGVDFTAMEQGGRVELSLATNAFIGLYVLALTVVLIWLSARLALLSPVIVMERRGVASIARSFRLTRPVTMKIIGTLILYAIVFLVAYLAAQFVFGSVLHLLLDGAERQSFSAATVLTSILTSVVVTGFVVLAAAFVAKLYLAIRDAREAIVESV